ncbi:hypothetical protein EV191_101697 [Tamaricihabitans halophyticus]|uniref:Uncharacterized protein n=1 Tax=Tamaricihabitans halophyticus TaxID=1262583 RepID=A0A4R2RAM0_9PSEU|nr:hypothetical protein [Tamaricihabitans halophyticus]TCP56751.1 hypothetical protein EV191_101697 [Tamaricihabitans halophyticus]
MIEQLVDATDRSDTADDEISELSDRELVTMLAGTVAEIRQVQDRSLWMLATCLAHGITFGYPDLVAFLRARLGISEQAARARVAQAKALLDAEG